jgi:uncharacterized protein YkwD
MSLHPCRRKVKRKSKTLFLILPGILLLPGLLFAQTPEEKKLFDFVNSERLRERVAPLLWDDAVYQVALAHSKDMAATGNMAHKGTDGSEPHERVQKAGIYSSRTGENIARDNNVTSAHTMLMQSLYHRENILEPDYTHAAVAVVHREQFLYVTEVFIHKINDYAQAQGRQLLIRQLNSYRDGKKLGPLSLSDALNKAAQAHVDMQKKFDSLSPMLIMSPIARSNRHRTVVSVYTTTSLLRIPAEVRSDAESTSDKIGIGFKRVQGKICNGGCYLVVLVFG